MLVVQEPKDLLNYINYDLGYSEWVLIDQKKIDDFAAVTGDHQWIHVDTKKAETIMPGGKTIAHGLLTLSMTVAMGAEVLEIKEVKQSINYGLDKVRFTSPVAVNSKVRMSSTISEVTERENGAIFLRIERIMEIEGVDRPAMIANTISLIFPKKDL
jgi:acyl dehydratase